MLCLSPQTEASPYAWLIVKDHLFEETGDPASVFKDVVDDEAGTTGPRNAPAELLAALDAWQESGGQADPTGIALNMFTMSDDDGEIYYTGVLAYRLAAEGEEAVVAGPLADFGMPNAGCAGIEYSDHPEWAVG